MFRELWERSWSRRFWCSPSVLTLKAELHKGSFSAGNVVSLRMIDTAAEGVQLILDRVVISSERRPASTIDPRRQNNKEQSVSLYLQPARLHGRRACMQH